MTIHRFRVVALLVCFVTGSSFAASQTCPTSNFAVTTSLTFDKKVEDVTDDIEELHKCFNVLGCQLTEYSVGQCGGSKTTRVAGAQKAATVQLKPGGCDTVYNCQGVYVTKETYAAVRIVTPNRFNPPFLWEGGAALSRWVGSIDSEAIQ